MDYLYELENKTIYIIREAYARFRNIALLWSIGKDSTSLLWIARKAFFGKIPFPIVHIDTGFKEDPRRPSMNDAGVTVLSTEDSIVVEKSSSAEELGRFVVEREQTLQGAGILTEGTIQ